MHRILGHRMGYRVVVRNYSSMLKIQGMEEKIQPGDLCRYDDLSMS